MKKPFRLKPLLLRTLNFVYLLIVLACIVTLLYRFFVNPELLSASLSAISFPVVILFCAMLFRDPISKRIGALERLTFKNGVPFMEFSKEVLEKSEVASEKIEEIPGLDKTDKFSKERIEEIIKISAAWGYDMAKLGFNSKPIPVISWQGDNPRIDYGFGDSNYGEKGSEAEMLKEEIIKIEREIAGLSDIQKLRLGMGPSKLDSLRTVRTKLQKRLKTIDPSSTFID